MKRIQCWMCAGLVLALSGWLLLGGAATAMADPCGMVPPVLVDNADNLPIKRIGPQKTYVFYKNGLETFIIRPGYEGRVDEFGMLIPFPVPPALRKAPDNVFEQIANAIDPPEIVIDVRPSRPFVTGVVPVIGGGLGGGGGLGFAAPAKDEVKVVREEAVGMYEVAVLAAGSARALKTWLTDHQYNYPSGMDLACNEYVAKNWCFVAVKTRVAVKEKADAKPAQREVDADLPEGSVFDGHVQAMEFRFPSDELIVPMRLSAFNEGETRNIVYLIADKPAKIRNIPEEYVMRQMSGDELYDNLTKPLPLRIIGGTAKDIPDWRRRGLAAERNPAPHNGVAADIFAGDLLAAKSGTLLSEHEVQEKELLAIGEELDLRGEAFDAAVRNEIAAQRHAAKNAVLHHLKDMVLTVVDGEFPREVLAKDNLRFAQYIMPLRKSDPEFYDAKQMGPGGKKPGVRHTGSLDDRRMDGVVRIAAAAAPPGDGNAWRRSASLLLLVGGLGLLVAARAVGQARRTMLLLIGALALFGLLFETAIAFGEDQDADAPAEEAEAEAKPAPIDDAAVASLLRDLDDAAKARQAVDQLAAIGEPVTDRLITIAKRERDVTRRGWAIVALGRIGGDDAFECLAWLTSNKKQPEMIRLWASAAQIKAANTPEQLDKVARLVEQHPALERPLGKNIERQLQAGEADLSLAGLLQHCMRSPQYERFLAGPIVAQGGAALVKQMLTSEDQEIRRKAAGFVGTAAQAGEKTVATDIAAALAFQPDAEKLPWDGGPLFIPGIQWDQYPAQAKQLAQSLIAWHVWCGTQKYSNEQRKIDVMLGSIALSAAAGYSNLGQSGVSSARWVQAWKDVVGPEAIGKMLAPQGLAFRDGKLVEL